uniref:60S ribosomal protein L35a-1 n=1 Tax=Stygiella incarcerata TaxID=1712417 RepID=A0A192ZI43_9EUKA|nr:60S ribosomal protein L35a-1 [Stygiella incarcerata]|eukprot:TRINITY_DN1765_c0_g1_i1.p2 TRINITY_DN1765_c0_g1~~TRINITY_DN1765_c0_g1_i1.p2  ORF type:complete len:112 (-),score=19.69 TRINITY_DN1765_c0_g1_i1:61-396(-)
MCGRLYVRGKFLGFQRGLRNQNPNTSLLKLEGVMTKDETKYYFGKRVAYIYKAKVARKVVGSDKKSRLRVLWGRITRSHGNSGVVRAKFAKNLPAEAMGSMCRVMLFPQRG